MDTRGRPISELLEQARMRLKVRQATRGFFLTLLFSVLALLGAALAAEPLSQKPAALIALRIVPALVLVISAWLLIVRPLRSRIPDVRLARLVEEKCELSDRLVTAVECGDDPGGASPAIVSRLTNDASSHCSTVDMDRIVDPKHAIAYGAGALVVVLALVPLFFVGPAPLSQGMAVLYLPIDGSVSASTAFINVSPGTARVPRGSDQKIKASLNGFDAPNARIFVRRLDADGWSSNAMEPAKNAAEFQYLIFNIQDSVVYYVESSGVRSPEFTMEVADLPFVKSIDLVLDFPAYTKLPSKKIENGGEVAAVKGTAVNVVAALSGRAKSARIVLGDGARVEMTSEDGLEFTGQFTVKQNGTYKIEVTSLEGERYNGSNEYDITVLDDHPPVVVIDKPGRDVKVTSIQEVFAQARAEDDYGVNSIELFYSVNGGEERTVKLQDLKSDSARTLSGTHTFFLEEHGLKPGDFISYYAKARDNAEGGGQESTSDIYFLEVRPFDREFRQAQQQGGGGGGEQDSNALTRRQREIVAATFRVQREQDRYTPQEADENFGAVTLSQERLKADAEVLAERIRRRLGDQLNTQSDFAKLIEHLTKAAKEMEGAVAELKSRKAKEALPPEQRALQQLLRAESIFREIQVAQGGGGGGGQGGQNAEELADLFELQLDKMKNQYETVQREQQGGQNQQQDEIARRLQELARRQQQQLEQQMRSQQQAGGGGGGGSQRQQQEMVDEARRMARELERLSRDRRDPKLQETARQLQQAADEMQRSQALSNSSNSQQAAAQAARALDRLEQARRTLDSARRSEGQQSIQRLRQRTEEALKRQNEISRDLDEIARSGNASDGKKQTLGERKESLADQMSGLETDIDQAARTVDSERKQAGDNLRDAANSIRRNRLPDRIRQNNILIENGWYDQARERERIIRSNIEEVLKNLQAAEGIASRRSEGESLEDALNRARELADNLESLRRRIESQQNQDGQRKDGQNQQGGRQSQPSQQSQGQQSQSGQQAQGQQNQSGQQSQGQQSQSGQQARRRQNQGGQQSRGRQNQAGQQSQGQQSQAGQQAQGQQNQSGQQGQGQQSQSGRQSQGQQNQPGQRAQGQQSGRQQGSQPGDQSSRDGGQFAGGPVDEFNPRGGGPLPPIRQLESELRQRLAEAEALRRQLGPNSDLARELNRAIEQLRRISPEVFDDPAQLALLKNEVIDPLRHLELELAKRLQAKLGGGSPGSLGEGEAPDRYKKKIEDYYRRLSRGR